LAIVLHALLLLVIVLHALLLLAIVLHALLLLVIVLHALLLLVIVLHALLLLAIALYALLRFTASDGIVEPVYNERNPLIIFQIYHGKNKLIFNEMMMRFTLY
jgi:hypothetical protein